MISYQRLLEIFWGEHNPCRRSFSVQYRAAIFHHDAVQKKLAEESAAKLAKSLNDRIQTAILPLERFYPAEDYHQKYRLRSNDGIEVEFLEMFDEPAQLMNSHAAARVNAYLAGHGTKEQLAKELGRLGLSKKSQERIREVHAAYRR